MQYWSEYSKKCLQRIENPRNVGSFSDQEAMVVAQGKAAQAPEGIFLTFSLLVDASDGMIVDARFQLLGPTFLIAALDVLCELALQKHYSSARRLNLDLLEKQLGPFSETLHPYLNLCFEALRQAATHLDTLNLPQLASTPLPPAAPSDYPTWDIFSKKEKLEWIEKVINEQVRPYIELDEGGIVIQELVNDKEVIIAYQGACTSCHSSIGSTLSAIQGILQAHVHPELVVTANLDALTLS